MATAGKSANLYPKNTHQKEKVTTLYLNRVYDRVVKTKLDKQDMGQGRNWSITIWLWVLRNGKVVLGKDGKPMKASRRVQFDANKGDILLDYHDSVTNISHVVDDICEGSSKADDLVHTATEDESSENYEKGQAG
ncbi:hypothetical protein Tco_1296951 [Tanacetum coccineum]